MGRPAIHSLLDHVRRLAGLPTPEAPSDGQLLARLLADRDGDALALLMDRHGPMVLGVARRVLREPHAAEDVFQATFLVLARRPAAVRRPESLGSWLHGVALRLAVRAKRRPAPDPFPAEPPDPVPADPAADLGWREFLAVLDQELQALPARVREPLVLCYLEGRTRDEAARLLGWSVGTVRRRVDAGRRLLHTRLARRGVALGVVLAGGLVAEAAPVSEALRAVTVASVLGVGTVGESVAALAEEGVRATGASLMNPLLAGAAVVLAGAGVWAFSGPGPGARPVHPVPAPAAPAAAAPAALAVDDVAFREALAGFEAWEGKTAWRVMQAAVLHARRGDPATARRGFEQAARMIAPLRGSQRGVHLAMLAHCQARAGDAPSAAATYAEVRKVGATLAADPERGRYWLDVLTLMAEAGCFDAAFDAAAAQPGRHPRRWVVIAAEQARAGDPAAALRTLDRIAAEDPPEHPTWDYFKLSAWRAIAAAQFRAGDRVAGTDTLRRCVKLIDGSDGEEHRQAWGMFGEEMLDALADYAVAQHRAGDAAGAKATLAKFDRALEGRDEWSQHVRARLARAQTETGDREAAARTVAEYLRVWEARAKDRGIGLAGPLDQSNHRILPVMFALGDWAGPERIWQLGPMHQLDDLCEAMALAGRAGDALARARRHEPAGGASQAVAMLGVARGVVERSTAGRASRYEGAFAVRVPDPPADR